ncbi:MAG: DUF1294 domain-containing protein [Deltaproteobacteria bacterium]|nr:DUF1294 domain-containing protein [Deltaproteobacteria bacterium]
MRYQGTITTWKDDQGFGFIAPNDGDRLVFVHISSFLNRKKRPGVGETVSFELGSDERGRPRAEGVAFVGDQSPKTVFSSGRAGAFVVAFVFFGALAALVLVGKLPLMVLGLYVGASLAAFVAYARDKSAAENNQWRTPEKTLHLIALAGGWPGALVAQRVLRHKSRKQSFQIVFWITVILNCGGLAYVLTPGGAVLVSDLLGLFRVVTGS